MLLKETRTTPPTGWEEYWTRGKDFKRLGERSEQRREKFNPDLCYNLCAMAIENLTMGFLAWRGSLPENHSLWELAGALEKEGVLSPELKRRLLAMGRFQEICSLALYQRQMPTWEDAGEFIALARKVDDILTPLTGPAPGSL